MRTLLALLLLLLPVVIAQNTSAQEKKKSKSARHGVALTVLATPGFAYSYTWGRRGELRAGLDIDFSSAGKTGTGKNQSTTVNTPGGIPNSNASQLASDTKNSGGRLTVRAEYLYTAFRSGAVQLYAGGGLLYSYSRSKASNVTTVAEGNKLQVNTTTDEGSISSIGGTITAGLRFGVAAQFALYGEFAYRLTYDSYQDRLHFRNESNGIYNDNLISADSRGWSNEAEQIKAGLLFSF